MDSLKEFLFKAAVWWYNTAYGANTEFMCMCVIPTLLN